MANKLKDFNQSELLSYVKQLRETYVKVDVLMSEIDKKLGQLQDSGPEPVLKLMHFDLSTTNYTTYVDDCEPLLNGIKSVYLSECSKASEFQSEFILPLPLSIESEADHLLTPFPFFAECPVLSSSFDAKQSLLEMLEETENINAHQLSVS